VPFESGRASHCIVADSIVDSNSTWSPTLYPGSSPPKCCRVPRCSKYSRIAFDLRHPSFSESFERKRCFRYEVQSYEEEISWSLRSLHSLDTRRNSNRIGRVASVPTTLSGTPPDARTSRSYRLPAFPSNCETSRCGNTGKIDRQNDRCPNAMARIVSEVRTGSRRSGRTINR